MTAPSIRRPMRHVLLAFVALSATIGGGAVQAAEVPPGLAGSGVAMVPADAAFFSATLRAREQYDRFVKSNAYAALRAVPAVKRALDSLEEQRMMPGNPFSMADAFLQLPENAEAAELLKDMVATDTFVYGEQSCTSFVKLVRKLAAVMQAVGAISDRIPDEVIIDEDMEIFEEMDDDDSNEADVRRTPRGMLCQFGVDIEVEEMPAQTRQRRLVVQALVDNADLLVVPDVVWGFKTTKPDVAKAQVARLETLAKAALESDPGRTVDVARKAVAGGDFLVLTVRGESLPWGELERQYEDDAGDIDGFADVFNRLRKLDVCAAIGVVGDRVILSVGDSTDHLAKLAAGPAKGLLTLPAFAPLLAHADKPLTGISYLSGALSRALAQGPDEIREQLQAIDVTFDSGDLPEEAVEEGREVVERFTTALAKWIPEPGNWTAFSWLTDSGYEGYAWDWSRNQQLDGAKRLDLLEHAGGAPLAVLASRLKSDPQFLDDVSAFVGGLWSIAMKHGAAGRLDGAGDSDESLQRFGALAGRLGDIVRGKLLRSLADGQVGFVLDGKSRTKKPQRDLPASADPLPLPEPAIILPLADAKLFREGLSDLFALGDDAVAIIRELNPDGVPQGYRVPDPEKAKLENGTVWIFPLSGAGLDEQIRPAIGVGDDVAVLSLAPKQAARLLGAAKLETGSQLSAFEEPLAGAAALDVAAIVDAVKPWVVYLTRYGCVQEQEGVVDADAELKAADETDEAREALASVDVVLEVAKCLRAAVAEMAFRDGALVTHWRNVIRDLPAK